MTLQARITELAQAVGADVKALSLRLSAINSIGTPGTAGFGVGICPQVPAGFTPMASTCTAHSSMLALCSLASSATSTTAA